jgi:hypothetical protein
MGRPNNFGPGKGVTRGDTKVPKVIRITKSNAPPVVRKSGR